jgi:hypothetical protein
MTRQPSLQWLVAGLLIFCVLQILVRILGVVPVVVLVVVAGIGAAVAWMAAYDRERLARVYAYPAARPIVDAVCRLTGQPVPTAPAEAGSKARSTIPGLVLQEEEDFARAEGWLKESVLGHDEAIDRLLDVLQTKVVLRARGSEKAMQAPLAVFVLAGPPGIGKRYLATQLGRLVYRDRTVLNVDLAETHQAVGALAELFGCGGMPAGRLVAAVKARPCQTVVFDNSDAAPHEVLDRLSRVLETGQWSPDANSRPVSFRQCVFVLLCTGCPEALLNNLGQRSAADVLADETPLGPSIVSRADEALVLRRPDLVTRAAVVARLLERYCTRHGMELEYVAPEVITELTAGVTDSHGFAFVPARVSKRLREHLARAARAGQTRVEVHADDVSPCPDRHRVVADEGARAETVPASEAAEGPLGDVPG